MSYTRSLVAAVALSLAWIMGDPAEATGPRPNPPVEALCPEDVTVLEAFASAYIQNESYDAAIGPLARALQLEPSRRSLWVSLDEAVKKSGRSKISDAELTVRAAEFKEAKRAAIACAALQRSY